MSNTKYIIRKNESKGIYIDDNKHRTDTTSDTITTCVIKYMDINLKKIKKMFKRPPVFKIKYGCMKGIIEMESNKG